MNSLRITTLLRYKCSVKAVLWIPVSSGIKKSMVMLLAFPTAWERIRIMHVASCIVKLNLEGVNSLKEKRRILKSILIKVRRQFNVAAA